MRKHGSTPSWRDKHVTLAAISPPGVARGRLVGGQQSCLAGCKPPPLFMRGASSCSSQGRRQGEPWGASPRPSAPTYLPTYVRCSAALCWRACVELFVWSTLVLTPGSVVRRCALCCFLWCSVVWCWVWLPAVVFWWHVSVPLSLSGRVVCFSVIGVVCCGTLLPCVVFCDSVLSCGAVLSCSVVFLRGCLSLLFLFSFKNRFKARKQFPPPFCCWRMFAPITLP